MFFFMFLFVLIIVLVFCSLVFGLSFFFEGCETLKSSPFECGFQPFSMSGSSFSMPFFIISLMFLLFDVEIIIMSFPPFVGEGFVFFYWLVVLMVLLATCYEWVSGILSWI
ncbi:NADH dehydrogenase subunit 3 (mitochondrion) [Dermatophagoides farinae]|uniref:NADH dehydrogenase subunit 3 n=1 Tax=Dermatophagoides farinae TaxID=6954 RepID=UPI0001B2DB82|nr:NADH dehydrogenase subunit 3 [Dermatophagoides farinae]ACV04218.1 NADH dehydrogenase subunit 3 [Dermatophagoides farinae]